MLVRTLDYAQEFTCLAGACPHSCCIGWEVVLDEDTAAHYARETGPLGEKLRAAMQQDADGDLCFPLRGGRCPFLDDENLCEIHRKLGASATSITCQEHPRFIEDYGPFREVTFSASCPAANALLLGSDRKLTFLESEAADPTETGDPWLSDLLVIRQRLLEILTDRSIAFSARLDSFLQLAEEAQLLLDEERPDALSTLAQNWTPTESKKPGKTWFPIGLRFLAGLEILEPDWPELLHAAESAPTREIPECMLERITVYFAFRYLLKAINDGDLLSRAQLCVFSVMAIAHLAGVCGLAEALRRFSREIEHNQENLDALLDALQWNTLT